MSKVVLPLLLAALLVVFSSAVSGKTTLDVYYESLCPDSVRFITTQLYPNWRPSLSSFVDLKLHPFGKASYVENPSGGYVFVCQHGEEECKGNILHACGIDNSASTDQALEYVNCLMGAPGAGEKCAKAAGIDFAKVDACRKSLKGQNLHKSYGSETLSLSPKLTFVPWLVFDKTWTDENQWNGLGNVMSVACKKAPENTQACSAKKSRLIIG